MKEKLEQIKAEAIRQINESDALDRLNDVRVNFLGKKGELTAVLKSMKDVAPEERPKVGQMVNEAREEIERVMDEAKTRMERRIREAKMKAEVIDVTLPAQKNNVGHRHPNTIALEEVERIFIGMGYEVVEGPEVEKDYYNFEALNIPADHPAKDEQDTFYVNGEMLLRTQTSGVQVHEMEKGKLPIRMIAPGRVFRADEVDATHSPSFHTAIPGQTLLISPGNSKIGIEPDPVLVIDLVIQTKINSMTLIIRVRMTLIIVHAAFIIPGRQIFLTGKGSRIIYVRVPTVISAHLQFLIDL